MYEFRTVTDRAWAFREKVRERHFQIDSERSMIVTAFYQQHENLIPVLRIPMALKEVCEKMTVRVEDGELLVANRSRYFGGAMNQPEWEGIGWAPAAAQKGIWAKGEDGNYHNPPEEELRVFMTQEDMDNLLSIQDYWKNRKIGDAALAWAPDAYEEQCRLNVSSYGEKIAPMGMAYGHLIPGYKNIIQYGYGAIRERAQAWIDIHKDDLMGGNMEKYLFYRSVVIACDAAITLHHRYADKCREKASQSDVSAERKAELLKMADGLDNIAEKPARTFWEACQSLLLYQNMMGLEGRHPAVAFGRVDQYTWPLLEKELNAGTITLDEAQEIIDFLLLKIECFFAAGSAPTAVAKITGIGNTYMHVTIGGVKPEDGSDASNPVTYMILESLSRLKIHDPTTSLRIHKGTPEKLWELAIETSRRIGGLPLLQNDEIIIPGMMKERGFSLEDARDYGIIGCQEVVGNGNDFPAPSGVHPPHTGLSYGIVLAMALNDGKNPMNGAQSDCHTGYLYEMTDIEQVRAAVRKLADHLTRGFIAVQNYTEYLAAFYHPHALLSMAIDGCMESGVDVSSGGAKYNNFGGTATGLATVADAISTIKYMCFDKKKCTTRELYDAVMANWEGYEELRQTILSEVPHFGNDDDYVDGEMKWICTLYYEMCKQSTVKRGNKIIGQTGGLYGASNHVAQGYDTWATPDGRKAGEPIADAASPAQGRDKNGPTAVFRSEAKIGQGRFMDGVAVNVRIHPTVLSREDGIKKLIALTQSYFAQGGMEVQFNVVSSETMRKAQETPEEYRDLIVRIAGYSAYFVELSRDCQNDVISRTENTF